MGEAFKMCVTPSLWRAGKFFAAPREPAEQKGQIKQGGIGILKNQYTGKIWK
jgi:hypothetical protein